MMELALLGLPETGKREPRRSTTQRPQKLPSWSSMCRCPSSLLGVPRPGVVEEAAHRGLAYGVKWPAGRAEGWWRVGIIPAEGGHPTLSYSLRATLFVVTAAQQLAGEGVSPEGGYSH